ncbi:Pr6Pr family membrane protein [Microlunatus aurantiacus]|uniref:Pr6Pr family membrane protein n=1 Tax=Microlunatus aurantiacus TaxID=446786 RepID=UPI0031DDDD41
MRSLVRGWAAATVTVALVGVLIQLAVTVAGTSTVTTETFPLPVRLWHFVGYFTIQSNLVVIATVLPLVRDPGHDGPIWRVLRLASLVMITVTGLVHWFLLRPLSTLTGGEAVGDVLVHVAAPALTVLGWLAFGPRPRITAPTVARSMVWPVAWLVCTLVAGGLTGWYPYPFLDVSARGAAPVALTCGAIAVLLAGLSTACWRLDRVLSVPRATIAP